MAVRPRQFELDEQIDTTAADLESAINNAKAAVDRLFRLKRRLAGEIATLRGVRDKFEIFTEAEAAAILKLDKGETGERLLAALRRRFSLPHFVAGREPRYTRQHIQEITEILAANTPQNSRSKTMRRAA